MPRNLSAVVAVLCLVALCGCASAARIRVENTSKLDFTDVSIAGQAYGDINGGATSEYKQVDLRLGYAALKLTADGIYMTGQTLNIGAKRFTYRIDVEDLEAGHLAIEVLRD